MALLKLKKECIGKIILKGSTKMTLSEDMSQTELLYIEKFIDKNFIEVISDDSEEMKEIRKAKKQIKKDAKSTEEPEQ
jgi:hypothetical protein